MSRDFLLIIALLFVALNGCKAQDSAADDANECRESNDTVYAVASMGEFPPLYETLHDLYSTVTTFPVIEECSKETASLNNFEEKVKTQAQTMSTAALAVDKKVKEAGKAKALQGEAARQSSCVWQQCRRLYKKQQDMLSAISDGVKDRILIKAEKIGGQIRNQTKEWTIEQVKEALESELSDVRAIADALSPSVKDVVEPIITQVIANNVASQVITALRKSPMEAALETDTDVSSRYPFTEYGISEGLKRIAKTRQMVLTTGLDTADQYSEYADKTVNETEIVQESVNSVSVTMQCREVETKATEAMAKLKALHQGMQQKEAKIAEKAKEEIEEKDADVINSAMFAAESGKGGLKSTIQALMKTLPDESQRSTAVQEAASVLAMPQAQPDMSVESLAELLKTVDPKLDLLITKPYTCYVRILEVIGLIVKGCKSGTGSFDSIYQQTTSQANINNDQCSTDAMVQLPSKADIQGTVQKVAATLKFNPDCSSNKQRDRARGRTGKTHKLRLKFQDDTSKEEEEKPSLSQRWNICKLLKKNTRPEEISTMTGVNEDKIKDIDCKALMYDREEL